MVDRPAEPRGYQLRFLRELGPGNNRFENHNRRRKGSGMALLIIILFSVAIQAGCTTEENRKRERGRDRTALPMTIEQVATLPSLDQVHHWLKTAHEIADRRLEQNSNLVNALDLPPYQLARPDSFELDARAYDIKNGAMKGIEFVRSALDKAAVVLDDVPGETGQVRNFIEQALARLQAAHGEYARSLDLIEQARTAMDASNSTIAIRVRPEAVARAEAGNLAYGRALDFIKQARRSLDR